jgi:hypothetical protein
VSISCSIVTALQWVEVSWLFSATVTCLCAIAYYFFPLLRRSIRNNGPNIAFGAWNNTRKSRQKMDVSVLLCGFALVVMLLFAEIGFAGRHGHGEAQG